MTTRVQGTDKTAQQTRNTNNKNDPQKNSPLGIISKNIYPFLLSRFVFASGKDSNQTQDTRTVANYKCDM